MPLMQRDVIGGGYKVFNKCHTVFIKKTTDGLTAISVYIKYSKFINALLRLADMNNYITDKVFEHKSEKTDATEPTTLADLAEINTQEDELIAKQLRNMRNQEGIALENRESKIYQFECLP